MKTLKIIIALILLATTPALAQRSQLRLNFNYTVATPTSGLKDYVEDASWRGWTANLLYGVTDKLSVGLGVGFHDFYQKYPRAVYQLESGGHISAVLSNSLQAIPILASVQYNFLPEARIQPYVGTGIGGNIIIYNQYIGEFSNNQSNFGFALRPEAGVYVPIGYRGFGVNLNGIYNYMPYNKNNLDNINSWGVGLGVRFSLR
jgi:opacity protein-like surface antigen